VLRLKFWGGLTNKEVAERLGYSFQYIYDVVSKALFALRALGSYAGISTGGRCG
jgi:DNA-directed RNA polymerase specialized sigma subunit